MLLWLQEVVTWCRLDRNRSLPESKWEIPDEVFDKNRSNRVDSGNRSDRLQYRVTHLCRRTNSTGVRPVHERTRRVEMAVRFFPQFQGRTGAVWYA